MTPTGKKRPTLADVAARAGMSPAAVSMILNDRPGSRLSAQAAEKVRAAAAELGYRPNPAAQSLRLGKTKTIGFISDEVTITRYASGMIRGLLEAATAASHTVLIAETEGNPDALRDAVDSMVDRRVDGIIVGLMAARQVQLPALRHDVPLVIANGASDAGHPNVLPEEYAAGCAVAQYLLDHGHTRIGIVGERPDAVANPEVSVTIGERFAGITDTLAAAGVTALGVATSDWFPPEAHERTHTLLDAHPDLTALIAGNDRVAFGIYQALGERNLRVAADISVISFDDEELASYHRPGLTTARLPYDEMARRAVARLLAPKGESTTYVAMPLIERDSVAALPR